MSTLLHWVVSQAQVGQIADEMTDYCLPSDGREFRRNQRDSSHQIEKGRVRDRKM